MKIRAANIADKPAWLALRQRLRPALSDQQHERDWIQMMEQRGQRMTLLCVDGQGAMLGMIEVSRRAESDEPGSGPVAYVEALHVEPAQERETAARHLAEAAADWARARGCRVLAADTSPDNQWEQKLLLGLGFEEQTRKVVYRRVLAVSAAAFPAVSTIPTHQPMVEEHADRMAGNMGRDDGSGWWPGPVRAAIIVLGILSFYFTDIFSGSIFVGVVLPMVDVLFVVYLLVLFVSMKYRRRTGSGERELELYQVTNDRE